MDPYPSSRGHFISFRLLLVLGTLLLGQIFASPLPLSQADTTAVLYERNSSSDISSSSDFDFSLLNWEHSDSEVTSLNERGWFKDLVTDHLFLGVGFLYYPMSMRNKNTGKASLDEIKLPWKQGLKSKTDMYLVPNTKLAKPYLDDKKFKEDYSMCLVYGNTPAVNDIKKVYTTSEPESVNGEIVFSKYARGPANDIVMRIPQALWKEMFISFRAPKTPKDNALDAKWQKWKIQGWPKGLKVRGDGEDESDDNDVL